MSEIVKSRSVAAPVVFAALATLFTAAPSHAQSKATKAASKETIAACAKSYEDAQLLKKRASLTEAQETLAKCMAEGCPASLRKDCAAWLDEVHQRMPTVALQCEEEGAAPAADAKLEVDGAVRETTFGKSFELNPGEHKFVLRWASNDPTLKATKATEEVVKVQVVAERQQQKVVLRCMTPKPQTEKKKPMARESGPPVATWILGGVGVAGTVLGSVFLVTALGQRSDLNDCKGRCVQSDVDSAKRNFLIADVSFGVAVLGFAAAAVVWIVGGGSTSAEPSGKTANGMSTLRF
jgi:hypothetical protein